MADGIELGRGEVVIINTFHVAPAQAEDLVAALTRVAKEAMRGAAGFISTNLHVSEDGTRVVNYSQWRSRADIDAMLADPAARAQIQSAARLATSVEPVIYRLARSVTADESA